MGKTTIGASGINPNLMQQQRSSFQNMGKFSTVLSSDGVDPDEYCALAYQDSEVDNNGLSARNEGYAGSRLPARRKSPHKKLFLEPQESDSNALDQNNSLERVSWRAQQSKK